METGLLEKWYRQQCNGDWEHSWGIKIDTLDNPGWTIEINLNETIAEGRTLQRVRIERTEGRLDSILGGKENIPREAWAVESVRDNQDFCGPVRVIECSPDRSPCSLTEG